MSKPTTYQGFITRPDKLRLFSLSYRGFSSRLEFCLMLGLAVLLGNLVDIHSWAMDREALSWLGLHDIEYGRAYLQRPNGSRISFSLDCLIWLPLYLLFVLPASIRRARQEIAQHPAVALIKSERGYRASDFAALGGHAALADYLREVEASLSEAEENEPSLKKAAPLQN